MPLCMMPFACWLLRDAFLRVGSLRAAFLRVVSVRDASLRDAF